MKKLTFLLALTMLTVLGVQADKEVYTVFKDGTLTYYYDENKNNHPSGAIVELYLPNDPNHVRFATYAAEVKKAVIDPSMQEAKLKSFLSMFYNWTDVYYVENGGMHNLEELETITGLKYLDTSEATSLSCMFAGCWKLKGPLDLSHFNTSKVEWMDMMFTGCTELTELDLTSFDVSSLKSTETMFSGCSKLKTIYCNTNWTAAGISSSDNMFVNCTALVGEKGTIHNASNPQDVTYAHPDGEGGKPGYFTKKELGSKEIYATLSPDKTTMTLFYDDQRSTCGGVTDWSDFKSDVTTVVLDESMQDARPESTESWFDTFKSLTEIKNLDYLNTSMVTTMRWMFWDCTALKSIDLSHFDTKNVTNMWGMFYGCTTLTSLDLSGFNTEKVTSMRAMFEKNTALTSLDLSSFDTKSVTDMFHMFNSCTALKTIICADNADWNQSTVTVSVDMFYGCNALVGENSTAYDVSNPQDVTYAHPDEPGKPGYFTKKTATGMEEVSQAPKAQSQKLFRDGQLYLMYEGRMYDVRGQKVR